MNTATPPFGPRAATFVELACAEGVLWLDEPQLEVLVDACRLHADGLVSRSATIGCCWDADRLDLPRVGIVPSASMLSTSAARSWPGGRGGAPEWVELAPLARG